MEKKKSAKPSTTSEKKKKETKEPKEKKKETKEPKEKKEKKESSSKPAASKKPAKAPTEHSPAESATPTTTTLQVKKEFHPYIVGKSGATIKVPILKASNSSFKNYQGDQREVWRSDNNSSREWFK